MPRVVEKELFGIHICRIMDQNVDESTQGANPLPEGYKVYLWNKGQGSREPRHVGGPTSRLTRNLVCVTDVRDCVFCKIAAGLAPAEVVCEADSWLAFFPNTPATPGHTLVVPRSHVRDFLELDEVTGVLHSTC